MVQECWLIERHALLLLLPTGDAAGVHHMRQAVQE